MSEPNRSFVEIGTHVIANRKYIGTVVEIARNARWPDDAEAALYKIEYDTFWGKRMKWVDTLYGLHVINGKRP